MELLIRQKLSDAENHQDIEALQESYELIKSADEGKSVLDSSESFCSDLYVLCAEQALQMGFLEMSSQCLQMFFKGRPPVNQFLGRAYLCQSQLYTPVTTDNLEQFEKFVMNLVKAIDFALGETRYYFLIYNASVIYWRIIRPFFKPGFRHFLIPSLSRIVLALHHADDQDKDWTAELMIELLECFLDASRLEDAISFLPTAEEFIKQNVPEKYKTILSLMVRHRLGDPVAIEDDIKGSINLTIIYKILTMKAELDANKIPEAADAELNHIYGFLKDNRRKLSANEKFSLLLELARLCLKLGSITVAFACLSDLMKFKIKDQGKQIEVECLECDYEVQKLGDKIATYSKSVVEDQLKVIQKLDMILNRAIRLKDSNVIQAVCTTQWNLCLPLLQHNLQQHVRKSLLAIAEILEKIDSMMVQLRCQVHMEIARVEEKEDRIEAAMEHLQKAIYLDNSGQYSEYLKMAFHRLNLSTILYKSPERMEDQASLMIEQAKKGTPKDSVRKKRSLLVNAGLALAPEAFQIVLDGENEAKVASSKSKGQNSYLCAKAEHHTRSVQKAEGHLKRLGHENDKERLRLWSEIAKTARKQSVWDVCRAACRFCLLYDDSQMKKESKPKKAIKKKSMSEAEPEESVPVESPLPSKAFSLERDFLRTIAEIRFINAEATIHLLRTEGIQLNDRAVPPAEASHHSLGHSTQLERDAEWNTYSTWINGLSQYAMENFLRAAKIGEELNEVWIVHNAVVYVLNHNKHLIALRRQRDIVDSLQILFSIIKNTEHCGSTTLLMTLCNALARGLILPWIPKPVLKTDEKRSPDEGPTKRKKFPKVHEKAVLISSLSVDSSGLPDIRAALEVCEFAMNLPSGSDEQVPIAVRQQIIATWVKAKQLVQHQIGSRHGAEDETNDEGPCSMTKVFIGLEMYSCIGWGPMEFTLPNLPQLFRMALECNWPDQLVELQTLTRLTHFAHMIHDHELVMTSSQKTLELDDKTLYSTDANKQRTNDYTVRQEMLSITACTQGKSLMENLAGKEQLRLVASKSFVKSASYAGAAGNLSLAMLAARHFWNSCLPFIASPLDRQQLKNPTEIILKNIIKAAEAKNKQGTEHLLNLHQWPTAEFQSSSSSDSHFYPGADEDLTLRTFLYVLLFQMYADQNDWEAGLKVLDEAVQILPRTKHRLPIFKHMLLVKARLGRNYIMEIQKFKDESEDYLSYMWHRLALVSSDLVGKLSCFQNAMEVLQKKEFELKKVDNMLEFAEWLYCNQFPLSEAIKHVDWAINILLHLKPITRNVEGEDTSNEITVDDLRHIKQLEGLVRAHTIMAVISGHGSPSHEQHCLMAYTFVIRIWQVILSSAGSVLKTLAKASPPQIATPKTQGKKDTKRMSSASPTRKDKSSKDVKQAQSVLKEKPKRKGPIEALPASVEEWANYDCPEEIRESFKQDPSSFALSCLNIVAPTRTLYYLDLLVKELKTILCIHFTLPVLQLAEVIARDVIESKSLSDLYHLRISVVCLDLKLYQASTYHEKTVGDIFINEVEQGRFRQEIALKKDNEILTKQAVNNIFDCTKSGETGQHEKITSAKEQLLELNPGTGKSISGLSFPYLWMDKAETLMQLHLCQPARLLLSEAHHAIQEMNNPSAVSRCLYLLAVLANLEKNHEQSITLLKKAQSIGGNVHFWYNSTLCLTDAILGEDKERKKKMTQSCRLLQKTINVMRPLLVRMPNEASNLGIATAHLEARIAYIQIDFVKGFINASHQFKEFEGMLLELDDNLMCIEKDFLCYRYKDCSMETLMARADIHRMLGKHATCIIDKESHYLNAYRLAEEAVSQAEELFRYINNLLPGNETRNINTPLMRRLSNMKLSLGEILLDILVLMNSEKKKKEAGAEQIERIIEDFVRFTPDVGTVERTWLALGHTIGHNIQAQLTSLQSLCMGCPDIKAKYLHLTGRFLRLLADRTHPFCSDILWCESAMEEAKSNSVKSVTPVTEAKIPDDKMAASSCSLTKKQCDEYKRKLIELMKRQTETQKYLCQSTEVLLQCINVAINNNLVSVLAAASLEMVECLGKCDPLSASQFLALYQSCSASVMMKDILLSASWNTSSSQLSAMLHLQHHLEQRGDTASSLQKIVEQRLASISKAWGNLSISAQHFNIMNELPSNFSVIILQHSEDRSLLYGAVLEKVKLTNPKEQREQKEKGGQHKGKPAQPTLQAKIARCPVNSEAFFNLLEKVTFFKQKKLKSILKKLSSVKFQADENTQESLITLDMSGEDSEYCTSAFEAILKIMKEYLSPVLSQLDLSEMRPPSPAVSPAESVKSKNADSARPKSPDSRKSKAGKGDKSVSGKGDKGVSGKNKINEPGKQKNKNKEKSISAQAGTADMGEYMILLADKYLMELPLETLNIFQEEAISSVSRDFSLQLFYNRMRKEDSETEVKKEAKGTKESKQKGDHKKGRMVSINRVLPPNCIPVDIHNVKYVIDPYNDAEPVPESPIQVFKLIQDTYEQFTIRWDGVMGSTHIPSQAEWEHLLGNCSAFLFSGMSRFFAHIFLDRLTAMNIPECQIMILLDLVHTKESTARVSNLDEDRSSSRLSLEMPTETAIILSLIGVHSIIANQWATTMGENAARLESLSENLLKEGKTTGQTVHILQRSRSALEELLKVESPEDKKGHLEAKSSDRLHYLVMQPTKFNTVLYGLPNMMFM
ncbi:LOW QUALITY PROTEIN: cilia- and flagella-associated protein 46 [Sphaerodactylus townsendi]|uniref:LOW QUALITY PROTEIN: cilia- and flagella-associated protein 46 n=1 Tax=Sphaerodactylus townsendi TaxID=933632 RepID=UPI002026AA06|nr:LOW QUALITY PROTEIN: cilia- and flagella-associated protein 46 [Sphaerodactylus townsendi]